MTELFTGPTGVSAGDDQEPDYLEYIKSKFANDEGEIDWTAVAKAKYKADEHISNIEREQAEMRGELKNRMAIEDLLAKIQQQGTPTTDGSNHGSSADQDDDNPKATTEDIRKLVQETYNQETQRATQLKNLESVKNELAQKLGSDFVSKLKKITNELEITEDEANLMAATRPKAFLKLVLGSTSGPIQSTAPVSSTVRLDSTSNVGEKTMSWYKKQYPGAAYWDPKVQNEMHAQARKMGWDAFNR